jgi:hypothetical protein
MQIDTNDEAAKRVSTVKVCDAIMGSGKSQSAIAYMNEHPEQRFVYVTPYLTEAQRITDACPALCKGTKR